MKLVSASYGSYPAPPKLPSPLIGRLTTDRPEIASNGWETQLRYSSLPPRMAARQVKFDPTLNGAAEPGEIILWIDTSVTITDIDFPELVDGFLNDQLGACPLAVLPHPDRDCVYEEIEAAKTLEKLSYEYTQLDEQRDSYRSAHYPEHNGLYATTSIAWKNSPLAVQVARSMLGHMMVWGDQDQVCLPFVLRTYGIKPAVIPLNLYDNPMFVWKN